MICMYMFDNFLAGNGQCLVWRSVRHPLGWRQAAEGPVSFSKFWCH